MNQNVFRIIDHALAATGGLVLLAGAGWWWFTGRRDPLRGSPLRVNRLEPAHVWLCIAVMLMSWYLGGQIAGWIAPPGLNEEQQRNWQGVFAANFGAVANTVTCLLVARATFLGGIQGFGIGRRRLRTVAAWALAGWLVGLFATGVMFRLSQLGIERLFPDYQPPEHGVFVALRDPALQPWMRAFALIGAFTLVPVGEEAIFRGILQTGIQKLMPPRRGSLLHRWVAVLAVGSLFGAVHSSTPQHIPALIALGVLLGFLYERTGSLGVPILVHMLFNAKSLLWDYLARTCLQSG